MWKFAILFLIPLLAHSQCISSSKRFREMKGEVRDVKTGLIWRSCVWGMEWKPSKGCEGELSLITLPLIEKEIHERKVPWRLPTIEEIVSLFESPCEKSLNPLNRLHIPKNLNESATFLTPSLYLQGDQKTPSLFYTIDLTDGNIDAHTSSFRGMILLVR